MTTWELLEVWTDADFQWRLRDLLETLPALQRISARSRACALLDRLPHWKSGT